MKFGYETGPAPGALMALLAHRHELGRRLERQRAQEQTVDEAEDRGVDPDRESQAERREQGKRRVGRERTHGVPQIVNRALDERSRCPLPRSPPAGGLAEDHSLSRRATK